MVPPVYSRGPLMATSSRPCEVTAPWTFAGSSRGAQGRRTLRSARLKAVGGEPGCGLLDLVVDGRDLHGLEAREFAEARGGEFVEGVQVPAVRDGMEVVAAGGGGGERDSGVPGKSPAGG